MTQPENTPNVNEDVFFGKHQAIATLYHHLQNRPNDTTDFLKAINSVAQHFQRYDLIEAENQQLRAKLDEAAIVSLEKRLEVIDKWRNETDELKETIEQLRAQLASAQAFTPTHRHYKGGLYQVLHKAWDATNDSYRQDNIVIVYRNENGDVYVRDEHEFNGAIGLGQCWRFEPLPPSPRDTQEGE